MSWGFHPFSSWSDSSFLSVWVKTCQKCRKKNEFCHFSMKSQVRVDSTTEIKRERRAEIEVSHRAGFPSVDSCWCWQWAVGDNSQDTDQRLSLLGWSLSVLPQLSSSTAVATFPHPPAHPRVAEAWPSLILRTGEKQSTS